MKLKQQIENVPGFEYLASRIKYLYNRYRIKAKYASELHHKYPEFALQQFADQFVPNILKSG